MEHLTIIFCSGQRKRSGKKGSQDFVVSPIDNRLLISRGTSEAAGGYLEINKRHTKEKAPRLL